MSVENVKKFYEVLSRDKELQQRFIDLNQKYQGQSMGEAVAMEMLKKTCCRWQNSRVPWDTGRPRRRLF